MERPYRDTVRDDGAQQRPYVGGFAFRLTGGPGLSGRTGRAYASINLFTAQRKTRTARRKEAEPTTYRTIGGGS
jgi:hypothetical protein